MELCLYSFLISNFHIALLIINRRAFIDRCMYTLLHAFVCACILTTRAHRMSFELELCSWLLSITNCQVELY